ncbi:MAG: M20/M25/M40 family metallo-hydrolase [Ignavibacteria bacterium]|nr:M20/M25/M40 family metallo-hydrolase [Ignavibacteria bacterium]
MRILTYCFSVLLCTSLAVAQYAQNPLLVDTKAQTLAPLIKKFQPFVEKYRTISERIINASKNDSTCYNRLAEMCDTYGHRLSGSEGLEKSIDWLVTMLEKDGFDVSTEKVMVPYWIRGNESATLQSPRIKNLTMLGLGGSIATPKDGITAEVFVVRSFEELTRHAKKAKGKIVLFNVPFTDYGTTVQYRVNGCNEASRVGAVASLVRSVGPVSLNTPHTGMLRYNDSLQRIPHAAITLEDAEMLQRMQSRGQKIIVTLKMDAKTLPDAPSRNVIAEIKGSEIPEEIVVFGGHIDSWDVGQGAMDDGGGTFTSWEALRLIKKLGLKPKRTMRVVFWTNEENGIKGGTQYALNRSETINNHVLAIESDAGNFKPEGFSVKGSDSTKALATAIVSLLSPIDANKIVDGGGGADIGPILEKGIPGMELIVESSKYFWYHHTDADTMDKLLPSELSDCAAAMAIMTFIAADLPFRFPK